jgi:hypothetical protein
MHGHTGKMEQLFTNSKLCDVKILVPNKSLPYVESLEGDEFNCTEFYAVRAILANVSPTLENMLFGDFREGRKFDCVCSGQVPEVRIDAVTPLAFEAIMRYAYGLELEVTVEIFEEIALAADYFQVNELVPYVEKKLIDEKKINFQNVLSFYKIVLDFGLDSIPDVVLSFIWKTMMLYPHEIVTFLHDSDFWDFRIYSQIVMCGCFFKVEEEKLWNLAILKGVLETPEFSTLLNRFRYLSFSKDFLFKEVIPHLPKEIIVEMLAFKEFGELSFMKFETVPRFKYYEESQLMDVDYKVIQASSETAMNIRHNSDVQWRISLKERPSILIQFEDWVSVSAVTFKTEKDTNFEVAISAKDKTYQNHVSTCYRAAQINPSQDVYSHQLRITFSEPVTRFCSEDPIICSIGIQARTFQFEDSSIIKYVRQVWTLSK